MAFTFDHDATLLKPIQVGDTPARNRVFMAPLTRSRAHADGTPSDLAVQYYAQRAAAGLIISEATAVSADGQRRVPRTPRASYTDEQVSAEWAEIADAVHAGGGGMSCS